MKICVFFLTLFLFFLIPTPLVYGGSYPPDTTLSPVTIPTVPIPGYLLPITDPTFQTKITRVSDQQAFGTTQKSIRHSYSKNQAWNSDGSFVLLSYTYPGYLLDGNTYSYIRKVHQPSWGVWSNTKPNIMYGTSIYLTPNESDVVEWNAATDQITSIYHFSQYNYLSLSEGEGSTSDDDHYVALYATNSSGGKYAIVFDLVTRSVVSTLNLNGNSPDWIAMSHSGNYVVIKWLAYGSGNYQGVDVYNRNFQFLRKIDVSLSHGDFAYDVNGNEVYVAGDDCTLSTPMPCSTPSSFSAYRLDGQGSYSIIAKSIGYQSIWEHTSGRNTNRKGWAYISDFSSSSTSTTVGRNEVFAIKLDPTRASNPIVERFAHEHHKADSSCYECAPMAVPNRDGSKVMWASDWDKGNSGPIYAYIAEWPQTGTSTPAVTLSPTPTPKPGDANNDRKVDGIDYIAWLSHYSPTLTQSGGASIGDFNNDTRVDGPDYVIWLVNYAK